MLIQKIRKMRYLPMVSTLGYIGQGHVHSCCFGVCPLHTTEDRISWYFWSLTSFSTGLNFTPYNTPETCYTWICGIVRYEIQSWQFADSCNLSFSFITKSCSGRESNPRPLRESWVCYPLCYEDVMINVKIFDLYFFQFCYNIAAAKGHLFSKLFSQNMK